MNKLKFLANMLIAYILYPFKKNSFKNRKIWIVGGNAGELYVDNGRAMYEYLRAKEEIEEYWVINKNSKSAQKIPGKKLIKGSIKSYLYFMNAEVALFSHSISADIVPYLFVVPLLKKFHKKISEETEFLGNYASRLYFSEFLINIILIPKKKYIIQLINNIPKLKINSNILYTKNRNATIL